MKFIATNSIKLGRGEHRLIPCGFAGSGIDFLQGMALFLHDGGMEKKQATENYHDNASVGSGRPLQFLFVYQRSPSAINFYRTWTEWLSEGRTRSIEGELIQLDGNDPLQALACASAHNWQVLIYQPDGAVAGTRATQ